MALLQICATPLEQGLPSLATLLFNHPVHGIMPVIDRKLISGNNDKHHIKLVHRQHKNDPNNDASQVFAVAVQQEDGGLWTHGIDCWEGKPQLP